MPVDAAFGTSAELRSSLGLCLLEVAGSGTPQ